MGKTRQDSAASSRSTRRDARPAELRHGRSREDRGARQPRPCGQPWDVRWGPYRERRQREGFSDPGGPQSRWAGRGRDVGGSKGYSGSWTQHVIRGAYKVVERREGRRRPVPAAQLRAARGTGILVRRARGRRPQQLLLQQNHPPLNLLLVRARATTPPSSHPPPPWPIPRLSPSLAHTAGTRSSRASTNPVVSSRWPSTLQTCRSIIKATSR